ncbi:MAG TPA: hypothetical protein VLE72_03835 [Candidatus Saccharimonadales bacterium]|nr:hypothetical protein [Candidatus Saccharimonadales bacterium]
MVAHHTPIDAPENWAVALPALALIWRPIRDIARRTMVKIKTWVYPNHKQKGGELDE